MTQFPWEENDRLEREHAAASSALKALSGGGPMGLTPDHVKQSAEYKQAKRRYDKAADTLKAFNAKWCSVYRAIPLAERMARRQKKPVNDAYDTPTTKTFTITCGAELMGNFERFLAYVQHIGNVGHSCWVGMFVDGDGADRVKVKEKLPDSKALTVKTKGTYPNQFEFVVKK